MLGRVIHTSATPHSGKISGQKFCDIDEAMQALHGSNFPVETVADSAGGVGVVQAITVLAMTWIKRLQKHSREGGLQGEQDEGQQRELG